MKRLTIILAAATLFALFAFGQPAGIVTVKVIPSAKTFKVGQTTPITLELTIRAPYHINAEQPLEEFLIGTTVDFNPIPGASFRNVAFPPAEMKKTQLSSQPLAVYEGRVNITAAVELAPDFRASELVIGGTVGYQACDDKSCLPPAEAPFQAKVRIAGRPKAEPALPQLTGETPKKEKPKAEESLPSLDSEKGTAPAKTAGARERAAQVAANVARTVKKTTSPFEEKGLFVVFVLVFLGGLALNLTPCVYPLIPITISYFGGQTKGKDRKGSLLGHAAIYVLGMAVTYSVLGTVAALTGSMFGAALQYPEVLVAIAAVMVLLALSMFNVYEIRVPAFLNKFAGGSQKGFGGTFFMGLTCGIIAAPCIGPFVLGLLTYVGNRGSVLLGFSLFFVLALGLGLPFLLLGVFSGSIKKLPRSGAWMVWVRTIFGFVLLAMALYFLKSLFSNPLFYSLGIALILAVAGVYLAWIEPTKTGGKAFPYVRVIAGVIFFVFALYAAATGIQAYLDEKINAKLQTLAAQGGGVAVDAISWSPYSDDKLADAAREGKPVFIDFYADWCIPCKEMDKFTFSAPEVIAASRSFVMLKGDLTSTADLKVRAMSEKFQVRGVPTYVFLTPEGREVVELRTTGFEKKDVFLPKLLKTLELSGKK
jgi:thiol:disulfide interchange protein DsbD